MTSNAAHAASAAGKPEAPHLPILMGAKVGKAVVPDALELKQVAMQMEASEDSCDNSALDDEKAQLSPKAQVQVQMQIVGAAAEFEPDYMMQLLLCAVAMLEGADVAVIGPCLYALQRDIGLELTDLAYLGVAQAVCMNVAAPLWGILADRGILSRRSILVVGSIGQGAVTVSLAFVTMMTPMIFLRALNGVMLASLRPISNGVVADTTSDGRRGGVFGKVQAAMVIGMLFATVLAGPMANVPVLGFQGWRVAFVLVGSLSLLVGAMLAKFFCEPPRDVCEAEKTQGGVLAAISTEIKSLLSFFRIPTFSIMIMQGIWGSIPWTVMGNQMLFFKLSGMDDHNATALSLEQLASGIFGSMIGGYVADSLAKRFGYHGRPLTAQITVAAGIPPVYFMYTGINPGEGHVWIYAALIAFWGLMSCWANSGVNLPILSEIVPSASRSRIMAWECALENSIANAVGPPVVALLATNVYGYEFGNQSEDGADLESARALGKAMTLVLVVPWVVCWLVYSFLHCTYPRDVRKLRCAKARSVKLEALP
eukprot:TRINITY_DN85012_c0_g1_i1.p1 TRINITY_DN85012_c0_g1~~TRINITY_DN85012_c0_g1_i1.p1  ORF type:complete len:539 (+),score=112.71 TRINITY_DN85012_c0_g1_i1:62-1678(+)